MTAAILITTGLLSLAGAGYFLRVWEDGPSDKRNSPLAIALACLSMAACIALVAVGGLPTQ